ncbi:hypothetical protein ROJ8625_00269 [Roseivivax jejudonensis]|uniref:MarR family protein n=1 Tax=Roseivivax jejudonensis TaxID=1529041 RepID=A0A1X6Y5Z1_9RHOB|nr:MarR family EPS-associated transcriptional regulator [Roseivivax jejudonensis]SLN11523.1 hypothetical protein ROJ8625_00269 [Roseivivax jejudonensis]
MKSVDEDVRFRVMRALADNPQISQRELSVSVGISLGLVNYCLRGLADKGQIKIRNFRASDRKLRYAYVLTPAGLAAKAAMTRRFLQRRVAEYEALQAEIEGLKREVEAAPGTGAASGSENPR